MGRGLSKLQKWILCELNSGHHVSPDYVLVNFYGFEKRRHHEYTTTHTWFKDGEKIAAQGSLYGIEGGGLICINSPIESARQAFYHSVVNLRRRGLVQGSPKWGLWLTDLGRAQALSINDMMSLIDRIEEGAREGVGGEEEGG